MFGEGTLEMVTLTTISFTHESEGQRDEQAFQAHEDTVSKMVESFPDLESRIWILSLHHAISITFLMSFNNLYNEWAPTV